MSTLHITPVEGGSWAVKAGEDAPPASVHSTEGQAIASAYGLVPEPGEAEVVVHDSAGGIRSSIRIRRLRPSFETLGDRVAPDELDDPDARARALRVAPSNARLKAGIGKYPPPPGNFDDEEMAC